MTDVRATEEIRDGHLYFVSAGEGERRVFSKDQKKRSVDYRLCAFDGESIEGCALSINLCPLTLSGRVETYGDDRGRCPLHTAELLGGSPQGVASDPVGDSSLHGMS
ncbi:MAG: hypothetical protein OXF02_02295 [Simkaniaceae bacterium]|nr:hypothetical protein [Simkaniaceae bacterium]